MQAEPNRRRILQLRGMGSPSGDWLRLVKLDGAATRDVEVRARLGQHSGEYQVAKRSSPFGETVTACAAFYLPADAVASSSDKSTQPISTPR